MSNMFFQSAVGGFAGLGAAPGGTADQQYEAVYNAGKAALITARSFPAISEPMPASGWTTERPGLGNELANLGNLLDVVDRGYSKLSDNGSWAPHVADEVRLRTARVLAYAPGAVVVTTPAQPGPGESDEHPIIQNVGGHTTPTGGVPVNTLPVELAGSSTAAAGDGMITLPLIGSISQKTALLIGAGVAAYFLLGKK